jgi:hypothetical protein
MPSKDEVVKKISAALNERTGGQKPCNVCNQTKWVVVEQYVVMPVVNDPTAIVLGGNVMSLTPVVCSNCGNTHLINLRVLGFSDLSELKIDDGENAKP